MITHLMRAGVICSCPDQERKLQFLAWVKQSKPGPDTGPAVQIIIWAQTKPATTHRMSKWSKIFPGAQQIESMKSRPWFDSLEIARENGMQCSSSTLSVRGGRDGSTQIDMSEYAISISPPDQSKNITQDAAQKPERTQQWKGAMSSSRRSRDLYKAVHGTFPRIVTTDIACLSKEIHTENNRPGSITPRSFGSNLPNVKWSLQERISICEHTTTNQKVQGDRWRVMVRPLPFKEGKIPPDLPVGGRDIGASNDSRLTQKLLLTLATKSANRGIVTMTIEESRNYKSLHLKVDDYICNQYHYWIGFTSILSI